MGRLQRESQVLAVGSGVECHLKGAWGRPVASRPVAKLRQPVSAGARVQSPPTSSVTESAGKVRFLRPAFTHRAFGASSDAFSLSDKNTPGWWGGEGSAALGIPGAGKGAPPRLPAPVALRDGQHVLRRWPVLVLLRTLQFYSLHWFSHLLEALFSTPCDL